MDETEIHCEALMRHLLTVGHELLERNHYINGEIHCSIFIIVGEHAEEMTALVREWAHTKGIKQREPG